MVGIDCHDIAHIGRDHYHLMPVRFMPVCANAHEWGVFDFHHHFFVRGDQPVSVGILPEYR
jgi:hypothetical protein